MKMSIAASVVFAASAALASYAGGVISVNLTSSGGKVVTGSGNHGLAPAVGSTWRNVAESGAPDNPQCLSITVDKESRDGVSKALESPVGIVFTTDATENPLQRYQQDGITGADDAFMYNYLNDNGNITIDVTNMPYKAYKVILYVGADWAGNIGGWDLEGPDFNPIKVNGSFYRYSDEAKGAVVCDTSAGSCWGRYGSGTAEEGRNALITPTQYGSSLQVYVPRVYSPRRSALCAFQIVEAETDLKVVPGAVSVNFVDTEYSGQDTAVSMMGMLPGLSGGIIMADSWNNAEGKEGEQLLKVWDGGSYATVPAGEGSPKMTWSGPGTYYYKSGVADWFLSGYLADNTTPSVTVSDIPYDEYDLIVYLAADWGGKTYGSWEGADFNPVEVNGVKYTWSAADRRTVTGDGYWGEFGHGKAELGVNTLKLTGLTAKEITLNAGQQWRRGGIAAFQIVTPLPADLVAEDTLTAKALNAAILALRREGAEFSVELPAGKALVLDERHPLACSKLDVICKGDVLVDTASDPLDETGELLDWVKADLAKIGVSGVKGTVFHGWKAAGRVISVNVYSEKGEMTGLSGFAGAFAGEEIPASSWNDMPAANMTGEGFAPKVWNGKELSAGTVDGLTMSWDFVNVYGWGNSPDFFRRGWLTQGANPWVITFEGIPFAKYDVICYFNWDGVAPFWANQINGVYYIGDENGVAQEAVYGATWGESGHSEAAQMGRNAYRLKDQTSPKLTLSGAWMANLCAIQIVEPAKKRKYYKPLVLTIR